MLGRRELIQGGWNVITPVRTPKSASKAPATGRRRSVAALVALLAAVSGALIVTPPAVAGPVDKNWSTKAGPAGTFTDVSNGSSTPAEMSYSMPRRASAVRSWDFTATATAPATAAGPIKVPYTWEGLHAWFQVTTRLDLIKNGAVIASPEIHGPDDLLHHAVQRLHLWRRGHVRQPGRRRHLWVPAVRLQQRLQQLPAGHASRSASSPSSTPPSAPTTATGRAPRTSPPGPRPTGRPPDRGGRRGALVQVRRWTPVRTSRP